ncbi:hypothetical protein [Serratia marcescens]|uniref:hypothetical protein n=1 Tax=Serratia marcescens TaxID=615 RepID=UPI001F2FDD48|nr:hypothetical protein [Serratia marcescens]
MKVFSIVTVYNVIVEVIVCGSLYTNKKYNVTNKLLARCIGTGRLKGEVRCHFSGFNGRKHIGYVLLTLFLRRVFSPTVLSHERIFDRFRHYERESLEIYNSLNDCDLNEIFQEVQEIYEHTQYHLNGIGGNSVLLGRKLQGEYADKIISLKKSAEMSGINSVSIEMDVLNSFNDNDEYYGRVQLLLDIPISDILYCHNLIDSEHVSCMLVEPHEWVVINRSPTCVVSVPISSIKLLN